MHNQLEGPRFEKPVDRRDFFGLAATWAFFGTLIVAFLGMFRLPVPTVFPETDSRFPIGKPTDFPPGTAVHLARRRVWVFSDETGIGAVSTVCPHLGCIVSRKDEGDFVCPCHGSRFDERGGVTGGPAGRGLVWHEISLGPDGRLIVDSGREVDPQSRFVA